MKANKITVLSIDPKDLNIQEWHYEGTCVCGQKCEDTEINTVQKLLVNMAVTVCSTCYAAAQD